jgi:hypothetical protein
MVVLGGLFSLCWRAARVGYDTTDTCSSILVSSWTTDMGFRRDGNTYPTGNGVGCRYPFGLRCGTIREGMHGMHGWGFRSGNERAVLWSFFSIKTFSFVT